MWMTGGSCHAAGPPTPRLRLGAVPPRRTTRRISPPFPPAPTCPSASPPLHGRGSPVSVSRLHVATVVGVELLVLGEKVGALCAEPAEEDIAYLAAEVQGEPAEEGRAGLTRPLDDRLDLLR